MTTRRIDITLPAGDSTRCADLIEDPDASLDTREIDLADGRKLLTLTLDAQQIEAVLERLRERIDHGSELRAAVTEVRARLPDIEEAEAEAKANDESSDNGDKPAGKRVNRVSREEVLETLLPGTKVDTLYPITVVLSMVIAAAGLIRDSVAVIIGAMVIAPLLLPNMALALAVLLGKSRMFFKALWTNTLGVAIALGGSVFMGATLPFDPTGRQIALRAEVAIWDVAVALAAGAAGALAVTSGVSVSMIGVMVAVALLPPLVACGLFLGAGDLRQAAGAAMLTGLNISCVNIAAMVTFLIRGLRPWRKQDHAAALWATVFTIAGWMAVTAIAAGLLWWSGVLKSV
ncbi:MAG: TIGR00341 family protein [Planctomycetota bacterium]